ncbi:hypothetical protein, partial [Pseudomonas aeruginosa]|uniref:hypothetical protein n=1 Tax=Pseudomonas aeruginosa TaxID=287 RepID=UPI003F314C16
MSKINSAVFDHSTSLLTPRWACQSKRKGKSALGRFLPFANGGYGSLAARRQRLQSANSGLWHWFRFWPAVVHA